MEVKWPGDIVGFSVARLRAKTFGILSAMVGPFELMWDRQEGLQEAKGPTPVWWAWSWARVWKLEVSHSGDTWAWGAVFSWDRTNKLNQGFRFHFGHYTLLVRWLPAHVSTPRFTMREFRRMREMEEAARQVIEKFPQLFKQQEPPDFAAMLREMLKDSAVMQEPHDPTLDFRGNPNLN